MSITCCGGVLGLVDVGSSEPALFGALARPVFDTGRTMAEQPAHDVGFVLELTP
jgi:hypothetical protein